MIATRYSDPITTTHPQWYYYLTLPDWSGDPDKRVVERIAGMDVEKKMGAYESSLANVLNRALGMHVEAERLGHAYVAIEIELPVILARRKPDLAFVSDATWPFDRRVPSDPWWPVCPDLAVESVSPYELTHATLAKVHEYFAAGVKAVWLILPNVEQVYCYSSPTQVRILTKADELTGDPVVPGFRMPLADLFPPAADSEE